MGTTRTALVALLASLGILAACAGIETPTVRPVAQPTPAEQATTQPAEPTVVQRPTAEPTPPPAQPTEIAGPTAAPGPTSVEPTVGAEPTPAEATGDAAGSPPVFVEAPAELTALIGTIYRGDLDELKVEQPGGVGGGAIINTGDDSLIWSGLAWRVEGDRIRMGISSSLGRTADGKPIWQLESAWMLLIEPDSIMSIGNDVCKAEQPTHDYQTELFVVIINQEQTMAKGAWTMTLDGPVEYEAFASLDCEPFFP